MSTNHDTPPSDPAVVYNSADNGPPASKTGAVEDLKMIEKVVEEYRKMT